jgi:hypothetical protein
MGNVAEALGRSFERLLRWLYPAALFLVVAYAARPSLLKLGQKLPAMGDTWGLILVALVAGFIAYLLQSYVWTTLISEVLDRTVRWSTRNRSAGGFVAYVDRRFDDAWRRWGHNRKEMNDYLNYAWATYHAASMTGWLTIVFTCFKESRSFVNDNRSYCVAIVTIAGILFLASIWQYLILSRVAQRFEMPPNLPTHTPDEPKDIM